MYYLSLFSFTILFHFQLLASHRFTVANKKGLERDCISDWIEASSVDAILEITVFILKEPRYYNR